MAQQLMRRAGRCPTTVSQPPEPRAVTGDSASCPNCTVSAHCSFSQCLLSRIRGGLPMATRSSRNRSTRRDPAPGISSSSSRARTAATRAGSRATRATSGPRSSARIRRGRSTQGLAHRVREAVRYSGGGQGRELALSGRSPASRVAFSAHSSISRSFRSGSPPAPSICSRSASSITSRRLWNSGGRGVCSDKFGLHSPINGECDSILFGIWLTGLSSG